LVATSAERTSTGLRLRIHEACGRQTTWTLPSGSRAIKYDFTGRQLADAGAAPVFRPFEICDLEVTP
ncbi:MAG: hypothetical protein Q7J98_05215, partial [Kiritimatiellia bacterium]|nr:hypothetical protein [Kiritimatiellia bacterium]